MNTKYFTFKLVFYFLLILSFSGCSLKSIIDDTPRYNDETIMYKVNENKIYDNLNGAINSLSNQLFLNNSKDLNKSYEKIAISTFTNNDNIKKTSTLGRVLSESLINDLHTKGFRIIDLTTKNDLSINDKGIFYLSRELKELKEKNGDILVLTGTYSKFDYDSIVLNARLLDVQTSDVISTARVIYTYKDCSLVDLCDDEKIRVIKDR